VADGHDRVSGPPGDAGTPAVGTPALRLVRRGHGSPVLASAVQHDLDLARILREEAPHPLDQRGPVGADEDPERPPGGAVPDPERGVSESSGQ